MMRSLEQSHGSCVFTRLLSVFSDNEPETLNRHKLETHMLHLIEEGIKHGRDPHHHVRILKKSSSLPKDS